MLRLGARMLTTSAHNFTVDCKQLSEKILKGVKERIGQLGLKPQLQVIKTTTRADSDAYIRRKRAVLSEVGIDCIIHDLSEAPSSMLLQKIRELNDDERIKAILVQMPLKEEGLETTVMNAIDPAKDVDGFHPTNLLSSNEGLTACTAAGIMALLEELGVPLRGLKVTVVGKSRVVGLPISLKLLEAGATVTICHRGTQNLKEACRSAELLVVAAGRVGLIGAEHVSPGAVVIDVGINVLDEDGTGKRKIVGDVRFEEVSKVASFVSPVPGGVGLLTVACLAQNVLKCHQGIYFG